MKEIKLKARAKINLSLDVLGQRENGYHEVKMVMQTINLYDRLIMRQLKKPKIEIRTNLHYLPTDERNLVYQVIDFMKKTYDISEGVRVDLHKMIPVAAGMAGGSSDAAQTIIGMNRLFGLCLSKGQMMSIGEKFGADIPYCIFQGTALAEGLGEKITGLAPFPMMHVLIVKPKFSMSTALVYKAYDENQAIEHPKTSALIEAINRGQGEQVCDYLENVLERVTIKEYPEISRIKTMLKELGAKGVLMSGSGPSVYALFDRKKTAEKAYAHIKKQRIMQFVYLTTIYNRKKG